MHGATLDGLQSGDVGRKRKRSEKTWKKIECGVEEQGGWTRGWTVGDALRRGVGCRPKRMQRRPNGIGKSRARKSRRRCGDNHARLGGMWLYGTHVDDVDVIVDKVAPKTHISATTKMSQTTHVFVVKQ